LATIGIARALTKIGMANLTYNLRRFVRHGRYITFQMAEVAIPCELFAEIMRCSNRLRPAPALI
jgi:hypothetical protein